MRTMSRNSVRYYLLSLVLLATIAYVLGLTGSRWYFLWGNTVFHFAGGLLFGALTAEYYASEFGRLSQPLRIICIVSIVTCIGVIWEFHEFILSQSALSSGGAKFIGDLRDTINDLLMDMLGGITAALVFWRSSNARVGFEAGSKSDQVS